ncbi:MAG TPA: type II toxin-antitoxin system Phd/YefM family antitoxin [Candidatus Faecalibacterium faecipullorum]|uniref:Type II toxin-antitoxin system Phd/YefM family antitoxin n=1 Tax=Candidatus Faecalibacterium faecipullorum TaxID=2838578 RepID=A0A9D2S695_9FIRM|nr:type II toxin-antitoxin system Phd/YefM family antitoxin [Candidatus Faecalibacterium faecipullorum]
MASVISAIKNTVPISLFNRGQAGKIFEEVRKSGAKVVMKNNVAECVLLSPEEYVRLMDEVNDAKLEAIAAERLARYDPKTLVSQEEMMRELGLTEKDLEGWEDVEIE